MQHLGRADAVDDADAGLLEPRVRDARGQRLAGGDARAQRAPGSSSSQQRAVAGRRGEQRRDAVRADRLEQSPGWRASAPSPRRSASGTAPAPPSPNVNASGGVPEKTSSGAGRRTWRANVSQHASRSRWKCTQPFGVPVVPEVKAMIATSSAAVSTGSNDPRAGSSSSARRAAPSRAARAPRSTSPASSRAASARADARLLDDLGDLPRAQQRHRRHDDPAREQDPEPRRDRLGRVRRVQQHARARLDRQRRARPPSGALAQLRVATTPPAIATPSCASSSTAAFSRGGYVEQQQVRPASRGGQPVAGERVHQRSTSRAITSCCTSDAPS